MERLCIAIRDAVLLLPYIGVDFDTHLICVRYYHITTPQPKKRRAVIWPSVLNEDPHAMDIRTDHGALPVEKGTKYGANVWIHQRDFQEPFSRGCI